jgi:hypothetical protein
MMASTGIEKTNSLLRQHRGAPLLVFLTGASGAEILFGAGIRDAA